MAHWLELQASLGVSLEEPSELEKVPEPDLQQHFEDPALVGESHLLDAVPHRPLVDLARQREQAA